MNVVKTISKTATGIVGVQGPYVRMRLRQRRTCVSETTEVFFQATWQQDGEKKKRTFAISVYGYARALQLAIEAREKAWK